MKKLLFLLSTLTLLLALSTVSAAAVTNGVVKVGLYYGSSALYSANAMIEDGTASGFQFGYYDESRSFVSLGDLAETSVSVTPDGNIAYSGGEITSGSGSAVLGGWHVQLPQQYGSFAAAQSAARSYDGGFAACLDGVFYVRAGSYESQSAAESAAASLGGTAVGPSATGVTVTRRGERTVLLQFDYSGWYDLALQARGSGAQTWFKNHLYYGGFTYKRVSGGNLYVINVVGLEDYLKGVVPYEMSNSWPAEALKAQAICARTYACRVGSRHSSYGFDVCATTDCQVYYGIDYGYSSHTAASDKAVEDTAGLCLYYNNGLIYAVYSASNGGASEDAKNVWGTSYAYLLGKEDPYEASIASSIPGYEYTVSYTAASLGSRMASRYSDYKLGTLQSVYVSEYTPSGNVYAVTFVDTAGKTYTVTGEKCRLALGTKSQRFTISGGEGGGCYVNGEELPSLSGSYVISGSGSVTAFEGEAYVITSDGVSQLEQSAGGGDISGGILISGTGNGHNVGLSQWGAYAMAKKGYSYRDILTFYYTGITIK
ncbi:MAG: SpoIID/LytB domain-containing protein [Oscillospiraceae bacterium]